MHPHTPESPPVPRRRRLTGILGAFAMLVGLAGVASPAYAAEPETTGSITGVVTGEAGALLEGVRVQLFLCDPDFDPLEQRDCWNLLWGEGTEGSTAADGSFSIENLAPGTYRAVIHPQVQTAQYVYEYWDGADSLENATDITVTAGEAAAIAPTLELGATVSGRVVDETGQPVSGGYVYAYLSSDLNSTRGGASVAADGRYTITGLPSGEYVFKAGPGWGSESELVDEYWQDVYDVDAAARVDLVAGQSFAADFELNAGAVIEGTVAAEGAPVEGVEVTATYVGASTSWIEPVTAVTGADGTYRLAGIQDGEYVVGFSDFDGEWAQQYWHGATDRASSTRLDLSPGDVAESIDANLTAGGALTGTLTELSADGSAPSANGYFEVLRKDSAGAWERVTSEQADAAGAYEVSGLAAGEYTVMSYGSSSANWATTFYGGVYFQDEATIADVSAETVTSGVDVETAAGVQIAGSIIDEHGGAAPGANLRLLFERAPGVWAEPEQINGAGDDISFRMSGLAPGNYIVEFADSSGSADPYVTQYWENAATQEAATVLEAPNGGAFAGINAVMTRTAPEPEPAPTPTVNGIAQVGQAFTVDAGDWGDGAELAYQWLADGEPLADATGTELVPGDALEGVALAVTVTGTRPGAEPIAATSEATVPLAPRFADLTAGGHTDNVRWAGGAGVIAGIRADDGIVRFDPKAPATRGVIAIALYRLAGSPEFEVPAVPTFADVPADHAAFTAVEYLVSVGGTAASGSFGPDDKLTRQHLAAFLYRASAPSFTAPAKATFSDVAVGSTFFRAIEWVAAERLTTVSGAFRPAATTSREELATFLKRWSAIDD
ncbi:collagen binding domain-containing protein [Agromyces laixinhei]|uniref:MSCRAMM family protein n=1 Tax=Agromyces laixinhei TaxID=2585717 RepID=UPI0012ED18C7|nr:carboxypeptidase-like regulatory domain-containing protein [Agromyces laixinhei]